MLASSECGEKEMENKVSTEIVDWRYEMQLLDKRHEQKHFSSEIRLLNDQMTQTHSQDKNIKLPIDIKSKINDTKSKQEQNMTTQNIERIFICRFWSINRKQIEFVAGMFLFVLSLL